MNYYVVNPFINHISHSTKNIGFLKIPNNFSTIFFASNLYCSWYCYIKGKSKERYRVTTIALAIVGREINIEKI